VIPGLPQRQISEIKVTELEPVAGLARVRVTWLDEVMEEQGATRVGRVARELLTDLAAVTLMGETHRHVYLVGRIRGFTDHQWATT